MEESINDTCLLFYFFIFYASTAYNCLVLAILRYEMVLGSYTNLIILLCSLGSQHVYFPSLSFKKCHFLHLWWSGYCSFIFTYILTPYAGRVIQAGKPERVFLNF
jgi:hypothetical protein